VTTYIPELQLGIIVLTNQQSGAAFNAITNTIKDSYLGITSDYVSIIVIALKQMRRQLIKLLMKFGQP
jgi:hypothetical protein